MTHVTHLLGTSKRLRTFKKQNSTKITCICLACRPPDYLQLQCFRRLHGIMQSAE
jgi:hypothetical protein